MTDDELVHAIYARGWAVCTIGGSDSPGEPNAIVARFVARCMPGFEILLKSERTALDAELSKLRAVTRPCPECDGVMVPVGGILTGMRQGRGQTWRCTAERCSCEREMGE